MSDHYNAQPPAYNQQPAGAPAQDPGQTMGILALVFAFVCAPVGIILGFIARKKSREAGFADNALGKWGFILGIVFVCLWVLYIILMIVLAVIAAGAGATAGY